MRFQNDNDWSAYKIQYITEACGQHHLKTIL